MRGIDRGSGLAIAKTDERAARDAGQRLVVLRGAAGLADTQSNGVSPWTTPPVEIVELARALGAEQRINGQISTLDDLAAGGTGWRPGSTTSTWSFASVSAKVRAARSSISPALPFDQAQLMVELLKRGNVTGQLQSRQDHAERAAVRPVDRRW